MSEVSKKEKTALLLNQIGILLLYVVGGSGGFEKAALQTCIEAWPNVSAASIRSMTTIPGLVCLPVMLILGMIVGKRIGGVYIRFRPLLILGTLLSGICGILPYFYAPSWSFIVGMRILMGIGLGIIMLRNGILLRSVSREKKAAMVGIGYFCNNITQLIVSPVVGKLSAFGWKYAFLINCITVVVAVFLILFIREPETEETEERAGSETEHRKEPVDKRTYLLVLFMFCQINASYPLLSGMSTFVAARGLGTAAVAGLVISSYSIGSMTANFFLGRLHKLLKRNVLWVFYSIFAIGQAAVFFAPSIALTFVGTIMCGFGFYGSLSSLQAISGKINPSDQITKCSTWIEGANRLGVYSSSYYISLAFVLFGSVGSGSDVEACYLSGIIVFAVLAVFNLIFRNKIVPEN